MIPVLQSNVKPVIIHALHVLIKMKIVVYLAIKLSFLKEKLNLKINIVAV